MKKYLLNKNVEHNSKPYPKGCEITPSDEGFKAIVDAGHADVLEFSDDAETESVATFEPKKDLGQKMKGNK